MVRLFKYDFLNFRVQVLGPIGLLTALALANLGCTEGIPNFEDLGKSLNIPQLSQSDSSFKIQSLDETLSLQGLCDPRGKKIEVRASDQSEWMDLALIAGQGSQLDCQSGAFLVHLESIGHQLHFSGLEEEEKRLGFRFSSPLMLPAELWTRVSFIPEASSASSLSLSLLTPNPVSDGAFVQLKVTSDQPLAHEVSLTLELVDGSAKKSQDFLSPADLNLVIAEGGLESNVIEFELIGAPSFYTYRNFIARISPLETLPERVVLNVDELSVEIKNTSVVPPLSVASPVIWEGTAPTQTSSSFEMSGSCSSELGTVLLALNSVALDPITCSAGGTGSAGSFSTVIDLASGANSIALKQQWGALEEIISFSVTYDDNPPPAAPTSLELASPLSSPGNDPKPTIRVNGILAGDSVFLYSDSSCITSVTTGPATFGENHVLLPLANELSPGLHSFWAKRSQGESFSPCSTASVSYEYDSLSLEVVSIMRAPDQSLIALASESIRFEIHLNKEAFLEPGWETQVQNFGTAFVSSWNIFITGGGTGPSHYWTLEANVALEGSVQPKLMYGVFKDAAGYQSPPASTYPDQVVHVGDPLILTVDASYGAAGQVTLPLQEIGEVHIDWGDPLANLNCPTQISTPGNLTCSYFPVIGLFQIRILGHLYHFGSGTTPYPDADKIIRLTSWGSLPITNLSGAFHGATNLVEVVPPPSGVWQMEYMFKGATTFNQDLTCWDVSSISQEPLEFSEDSALIAANKPGWGTSGTGTCGY